LPSFYNIYDVKPLKNLVSFWPCIANL
jgi:hypothetical protein